jgi:hypothetical protein
MLSNAAHGVRRGRQRGRPSPTEHGADGVLRDEVSGGGIGLGRFFAHHKYSLG